MIKEKPIKKVPRYSQYTYSYPLCSYNTYEYLPLTASSIKTNWMKNNQLVYSFLCSEFASILINMNKISCDFDFLWFLFNMQYPYTDLLLRQKLILVSGDVTLVSDPFPGKLLCFRPKRVFLAQETSGLASTRHFYFVRNRRLRFLTKRR